MVKINHLTAGRRERNFLAHRIRISDFYPGIENLILTMSVVVLELTRHYRQLTALLLVCYGNVIISWNISA